MRRIIVLCSVIALFGFSLGCNAAGEEDDEDPYVISFKMDGVQKTFRSNSKVYKDTVYRNNYQMSAGGIEHFSIFLPLTVASGSVYTTPNYETAQLEYRNTPIEYSATNVTSNTTFNITVTSFLDGKLKGTFVGKIGNMSGTVVCVITDGTFDFEY